MRTVRPNTERDERPARGDPPRRLGFRLVSSDDPLHPDPETARRLAVFAGLVRGSAHNLVSRRAASELEQRHIPECVVLARLLPKDGPRTLDVGSGGGFPGLVIGICRPDVELHLLDSTAKKTAFLAEAAEVLGVTAQVHTGRAEALARTSQLGSSFDVVTARAVAPLAKLVGWTMPFLREGGLLYAMKGERWAEELDEAAPAITSAGASIVATPDDVLPPSDEPAEVIVPVEPRVVMLARSR